MGPWVMYGHVSHASDEILFVTIDKKGMSEQAQYDDHFESPERFVWSSQNQTSPESNQGQKVLASPGNGQKVHLWIRRTKNDPFVYCGDLGDLSPTKIEADVSDIPATNTPVEGDEQHLYRAKSRLTGCRRERRAQPLPDPPSGS